MKMNADIENRKTLAAVLGIDEEEAEALLHISILISFNPGDSVGARLAEELRFLLARTAASVSYEGSHRHEFDIEIIIGDVIPRSAALHIYVEITRDRIVASKNQTGHEPPNIRHPVFLLLGACFIAAKCLGDYFGDKFPYKVDEPLEINFEDLFGDAYHVLEGPIELDTVYLAGAGAVGNGFLYGLHYLDVRGAIQVVDPKLVTEGNLNRCMFFTRSDVGSPKVDQICKNAKPYFKNLELIARNCTIHDLEERNDGPWLKRLIVTVDSRIARRSLQGEFPGEVYDASTTGIQEFVLHFNKQPIEKYACLSCVYIQEQNELAHEKHIAQVLGVGIENIRTGFVDSSAAEMILKKYPHLGSELLIKMSYDSLFKQLCGQGMLKTEADKQVLAPFAFVSVLAGAFLAIETVRRIKNLDPIEPYNFWKISPYSSPVLRGRRIREKRPDCEFCSKPEMILVSEELWKGKS